MSTLSEIEAAVDKLPAQQQKQLLFSLKARLRGGRAIRLEAKRGLKAATSPALEGLPPDLSTDTKAKVRALVHKRHAADR